jgi:ATP-binding cassette subfamily B protein
VSRRRTGLTRLGRYLTGRRPLVLGLVLVATVSAAAQSGGWLLVRAAIDDGIAKGDEHTLTVVVALYLAVNALGWICQLVLIRGLAVIGQGIVMGLRRDLFDHLTSLSLRYFSEQRAGWIIARVTSDVDAISDALSQGLPTLVSNIVLLPTTVIVLFVVDWRLGLVAMVILPPALVLSRWFQRKSAVAQLDVRNRIAAVTAQVAESVSGMAIVQAFNREREFQGQFDELNRENRSSNIYAQQLFSVFFPSIELLGAISTCAVLVVGSRFLSEGSCSSRSRSSPTCMASSRRRPRRWSRSPRCSTPSPRSAIAPVPCGCRRSPAPSTSTRSASPTARRTCCTTSRSTSPPAAASRSSARRAAASRRSRS